MLMPESKLDRRGTRTLTFRNHPVRCGGDKESPWFVARDVCAALGIVWKGNETLSSIPDDWKGVRKLRTPRRNHNGSEGLQFQEIVVINEAAVYKLAFRSNKPEADAFTNWVASEVLPAIRKTGEYSVKRRERYEREGKELPWIESREQGVEVRKTLTGTLQEHGVKEPREYAEITNAIYYPTLGGSAGMVKSKLGLPKKANLRDNLPLKQLLMLNMAELLAQEKIETEDRQGFFACNLAVAQAANGVANMVKQVKSS